MNNRRKAFCWTVCCLAIGAQGGDWIEKRGPLDRLGVHHAGFVVRIVDYEGKPVDTTVSIVEMEPGWSGRTLDLAIAETNDDGRAEFRGISSRYPLAISVSGSDDLRPEWLGIPGVSNAVVDLGILTLKRNFIVTGLLFKNDVDGEAGRMERATVELSKGRAPPGWTGPVVGGRLTHDVDRREGFFRLENFDPGLARSITVKWYSQRHSRLFRYEVPFEVDRSRPHRHFRLTLPHEDASDQAVVVVEDSWPAGIPPEVPTSPQRLEGRVLADGGPLEGVPVRAWRCCSERTDADGRFVALAESSPHELTVLTPSGEVHIVSEDVAERRRRWRDRLEAGDFDFSDQIMADLLAERTPPYYEAALDRPFEATLEVLGRRPVVVEGEAADRITTSWLHRREWIPILLDQLGLVLGRREEQTLVRAESAGRLARLIAYPPPEPEVRFDFGNDEPHSLRVIYGGKPVAGATVEVLESPTTLAAGLRTEDVRSTVLLNRLSTDSEGRMELLGDPSAVYVAYVYAEGFEPARARLLPGVESRVELVGRTVEVRFEGLQRDELVRVKVAGRDGLAAAHRSDGRPFAMVLAPGVYDISVQNGEEIVRGTSVTLARKTLVVDMTQDARPMVAVRFPELPMTEWMLSASRTTPAGGGYGAAATSYRGTLRTGEPPAEGETVADLEQVLRFPGTGRWQVHAHSTGTVHSFFTEVELASAEQRVLEMPSLDATLEGTMTYHLPRSDRIAGHHGVASPRMILVAADGAASGWNVILSMPQSDGGESGDGEGGGRRRFTIPRLPAGDYHLFHHLNEYRYRGDRPIWGGLEVSLLAGETTTIAGLDIADLGTLSVQVVDAEGRPVHAKLLRIRDRMHEAWAAFTDLPTTGAGAADPIPLPPTARLVGEPVTFQPVRAGWLELVLDEPAGPAKHYLRRVEPGTTLRLVEDS